MRFNVAQRTLSDTRDSNTYVVRKLADGKCWMTQNLRLVGSRTLTSSNSDVSSNFTLPASSNSFGTNNTAAQINISRVHDTGNTSYGAYYNWYTATAGTGTYSTTTSASYSICPKGWRLPTGGTGGELITLGGKYSVANFLSATSASYAGYWAKTEGYDVGKKGNWWSRTVDTSDTTAAHILLYDSASVASAPWSGGKHIGNSVRCIAR